MKKKITNAICVLAITTGIVISAVAPWWAVWFVILPVIFIAAVILLDRKGYVRNF